MKTPDIWVTLGKRGFNEENLNDLLQYNIAGIRFNTGRSAYSWIFNAIEHLEKLGYPLKNIMLDIGNTKPRLSLLDKEGINLKIGDLFTISDKEKEGIGAWLPNQLFFKESLKGDTVYFGDGEMEGIVEDVKGDEVLLRMLTDGVLSDSVSIGIKGKNFFHFYISDEEIAAVNQILECYPIRLIVSFVENGDNVRWTQRQFPRAISIIPKIETFSAYNEIDNIIELSDCIFIGRGDLGLSMGIEKIGIMQQNLINKAHQKGCKISVGTGTLDSLKWSEIPLRAEIIDITNSCLKGVDVIALTSETGGSKTPFKAINYLVKILDYIKTVEL